MTNKETGSVRIQAERSPFREHSVPLYLTSSFVFNDTEQGGTLFADEIKGNIYSRFSNSNVTEFTDKLCFLEKAEAKIVFANGMPAILGSFGAYYNSCRT